MMMAHLAATAAALACVITAGSPFVPIQPPAAELIRNGGFEGGSGSDGRGGGVPEWQPYGAGYDVDRRTYHAGEQCVRCDSLASNEAHGAMQVVVLDQPAPRPIVVSGWSKADRVGGPRNSDYSLYVDVTYRDGANLWGQVAAFGPGTHDWERRHLVIVPAKPVRSLTVYALFRNHNGTAWFDDFSANVLTGAHVFDSQAIDPPGPYASNSPAQHLLGVRGADGLDLTFDPHGAITTVYAGSQDVGSGSGGGFYVRDVAADGPVYHMLGAASRYGHGGVNMECNSSQLRVRFAAKVEPRDGSLAVDGDITDVTGADRAVTVYLALPIHADGWQWGDDIRRSRVIQPGGEYTNQTRTDVGATGTLSLYPVGCIYNERAGVAISSQMDWPSIYRIFYDPATRRLVIAWDFALTGKTASWPSHNARFRCRIFALPPATATWGFRAAAERFYALNPDGFTRRAHSVGIWIPFTDPSTVQHPEDFGFAFHEGDNSVASDHKLGILSFRYTEPMTYWMPMPPGMTRSYDAAFSLLKRHAQGGAGPSRDFARATLNSGAQDADGRLSVEFRNEPWTNGAVWILDPNPEIASTADQPTKASLSYTIPMAARMYGMAPAQDGEYLDSLEGWSDVEDYRASDIQTCTYPTPFDTDNRRPVVPEWYSTHALARFMSADLHRRGKLLMANTTPVRFSVFAPLCDVMGIEVDWLDRDGNYHPDSDAVFNLRRTMSAAKPYLLLMNTDFDRFTPDLEEKYFQRCMFYGVLPSMFSADASTNPYWQTPRWYNRDRALFKKYIPVIARVAAAGWAPITHAHMSDSAVYVERWGARMFTLRNPGASPRSVTLTVNLRPLGLAGAAQHAFDVMTGDTLPASRSGAALSVPLILKPDETRVVEVR